MLRIWENLCMAFTPEQLTNLMRRVVPNYRPAHNHLDSFILEDVFDQVVQIGVIELPDAQTVIVGTVRVKGELTIRSSKRKQYELAKRIIRQGNHNAGIFAFYDNAGRFRFSLVTVTYYGTKAKYSSFRRYTFFVDPELPNKTFLQQMQRADFSSISGILETFSLEAVTDHFYKEFKDMFDALATAVQGTNNPELKQDFALLFVIRIIFLGFVQKKGWLGDNPRFLQSFWEEYKQSGSSDTFYKKWLEPLFFEALCSPPGHKVASGRATFSTATQKALQMAPYLNGELFKRRLVVDDQGLWLPDEPIGNFFNFLFQYNFTVEENELYDEELELNPEFLGIIFERITNKDQGAVYTPRVEVDLMCRIALVKWLEQTTNIDKRDLYHLFFREAGTGEEFDEYQKQGDFSPNEIQTLIHQLENVAICDPAAGSGAFEVGMLQVLDQVLENLYSRNNTPADLKNRAPKSYERKKAIIANSLYGVEVKRWAVWINHLRLWLTLFVDMPEEDKRSFEPLLPNLTFKVRTGDSLVQRIGSKTFPVKGHAELSPELKRKITQLKQKKRDFFYNKNKDYSFIEKEELEVFRAILDDEIKLRQEQIRKLKGTQNQQVFSPKSFEQIELNFTKEIEDQILRLAAEIAELRSQKQSLKNKRPFIWSIEFAEIFFDRGGFDIIIGNPPYVRQEEIGDPNGNMSNQEYKNALLEMLRLDFPDYFAKSRTELDRFKTGRRPSGRSDLYTYFYLRSLRLLNPQGIHVFICSNSWLDVGYGAWLQEFFLRQTPLYFIIDNHARRSFVRADINTVTTVAGAPKKVKEDHTVRFVAFKKPFEEVMLSENLLAIERATATLPDEHFRVFPITVGELLREGSEIKQNLPQQSISSGAQLGKYLGEKWGGKYLRAPDIFFTILEKGKGKLVRLEEIAEVRRGFTTGANEFFYLEPLGPGSRPGLLRVCNGAGWEGEIEEEFLKPVIKSPRDCRRIVIKLEDVKNRIFMCHKNKDEMKDTGALNYIEWGERQGYHLRPSLSCRQRWWDLGRHEYPVAVWQKSVDDRHIQSILLGNYLVDQRLYELVAKNQYSAMDLLIALNNAVFFLFKELGGRVNLGEGALDTAVYEAQMTKVPVGFDKQLDLHLDSREIQNVFKEYGIDPESGTPITDQEPKPLSDRKALDDIVFNALKLTAEERKEVYRAVCQLVWERISKARSVRRSGS